MPLLKTRSTRDQFAQNHVLTGFEYFHRWRFHKFPVLWLQCLTTHTVKKFLYVLVEMPVFQFTSISLVLSLLLTKSLALSVHSLPVWVIYTHDKISPNGLLQLNNSSSWWIMQSLKHLGDSTLYSLQYAHIFFVFRNPELVKRLKVQAHIPWLEGNKYLPQLAVSTHSQATKNAVGLTGHIDGPCSASWMWRPPGLFLHSCFPASEFPACTSTWFYCYPSVVLGHCLFLNFMRFLFAHFSNLSVWPQMAA